MKKLILLVAGAVGATLLKRKLDAQQAERSLWAEATDSSTGSTTSTTPPSVG